MLPVAGHPGAIQPAKLVTGGIEAETRQSLNNIREVLRPRVAIAVVP